MADGTGSVKLAGHGARLDEAAVRDAYARWAGSYDHWFGRISREARAAAVAAVNAAPGAAVLEVGVGTGLALPLYSPAKRVTGIDVSAEMLSVARRRVAEMGLGHVAGLKEMDAQATSFADNSFDIAVAMFVASVVVRPSALVAELRRVVRPGGKLLFVNHFAAAGGPVWWTERALAPVAAWLGWHPDFRLSQLLGPAERAAATVRRLPPLGLFRLVELPN